MSPLESATTAELIDEMRRRFPCLILAGEKMSRERGRSVGVTQMYGPLTMALGLHARLGYMLDCDLMDDQEDADEGDETEE